MTGAVVVTGGAGFIGSNIVAELCGRGEEVIVCDRLRTADSGKWRNLAKHAIADLVPPEGLFDDLASRSDIEAVIHMGAISSTTEPDADLILANNFAFSRDLFQLCAVRGVRLIYASSAATYGDGALGFDDDASLQAITALRPLNPYGWSKQLFDAHIARTPEKPRQVAGLRFFNVYGPNEYHKGPMRSVIAKIWPTVRDGGEVELFRSHRDDYADGGQLRDFIYVKDAASVVVWLLDNPAVSGLFNVGTGQARSFADLASATFAAAGRAPRIAYVDMPDEIRNAYQYFTQARLDRLRAAGYAAPFTSLEAGIEDYVRGYLATPDPYR